MSTIRAYFAVHVLTAALIAGLLADFIKWATDAVDPKGRAALALTSPRFAHGLTALEAVGISPIALVRGLYGLLRGALPAVAPPIVALLALCIALRALACTPAQVATIKSDLTQVQKDCVAVEAAQGFGVLTILFACEIDTALTPIVEGVMAKTQRIDTEAKARLTAHAQDAGADGAK